MPENNIQKIPMPQLGYNFIPLQFLPKGKDEYYLRDTQNRSGIQYRRLTAYEIEALVKNRNTSDDWNNILVSDAFNPELVKNCKFFGLVRIGKLEPVCLNFSDLTIPVGLYNSIIISCDIGDNVVIDNVNYLSHFIIGNECILANINEMVTTNHAKFGNGIVKEGEDEAIRIWMEICNENGGRSVIPFNGMLPGDAYLWSKYRDDSILLQQFKNFTEKQFNQKRGYYGKIGSRTVIKNCAILKDVWIGEDAYIKGANKLKNLTINSGKEGQTQIGEGCELVNGIIGYGCRIFYGVKAVRFIMASHSQLKYGARLINSYLGNNATISCCEVLNSLIFPAHEQHHNNSFLCAALLMGQSNIAAGATIGSNHNSRGADGEMVMGRGFWPGLCVSLKHNSKFASYTILAKGDYPAELNITLPFSLVSMDNEKNQLVIMPGYWFMYNMYALARNSWKYIDRDKRQEKIQYLEYDFLAPDTVNEMFQALETLAYITGKAYFNKEANNSQNDATVCIAKGKCLLEQRDLDTIEQLEIVLPGVENTKRKTVVIKVYQAYDLYKKMIAYYGANHLLGWITSNQIDSIASLKKSFTITKRNEWINVGGQLMENATVEQLLTHIKKGIIKNWEDVHDFYQLQGQKYPFEKTMHALASLTELYNIDWKKVDDSFLLQLFNETLKTKTWITEQIYLSRKKDYINPYRKMVYGSDAEMEAVMGKLSDNTFINQQNKELKTFKKKLQQLTEQLHLSENAKK
ncbi:MAG: DUF4954 family protein [Hydrotalea flava]|uniref:DUF4954 family protein n=1 Tax=Hydrotalea sp. AMD TaxID=2501297 RepID=UPI00094352C8|nr:DUF4954 family protein [Hydrotalea sp. AMD]NIM34224.1 DUF4954 family protein [Hydrotalea flava]NIM37048.1 DUF4954 family protein [Hydrotalea flava]NIN02238.1 DUF4954 family protein [Hydrotalea flava]NIN13893.1 DUF4954 family protein [Hydrotalea flava]NIO92974.1 DUF4954 family protein [Hydrotalea flava]